MPYFFEILKATPSKKGFWRRIREIWQIVDADLTLVHLETEREALDQVYRKSLDPSDLRLDSWHVARYLESDDRENLLHFHKMGLRALGETKKAIRKRQVTPEFMNQWSILLSCHGFIVAAMMARGDDLQSKRAGRAGGAAVSKERQKKWVAHLLARQIAIGRTRQLAERDVAKAIWDFIQAGKFPDGFPRAWFEDLLREDRQLRTTYSWRHLLKPHVGELAAQPPHDIPPTNIPIPKT
jgi:hypothetical protein